MFSGDIARVDLLRRSHLSNAQDARTATLQAAAQISQVNPFDFLK